MEPRQHYSLFPESVVETHSVPVTLILPRTLTNIGCLCFKISGQKAGDFFLICVPLLGGRKFIRNETNKSGQLDTMLWKLSAARHKLLPKGQNCYGTGRTKTKCKKIDRDNLIKFDNEKVCFSPLFFLYDASLFSQVWLQTEHNDVSINTLLRKKLRRSS